MLTNTRYITVPSNHLPSSRPSVPTLLPFPFCLPTCLLVPHQKVPYPWRQPQYVHLLLLTRLIKQSIRLNAPSRCGQPATSHQENHFVIQAFPGLQAISQGTSGTLGCPVMPCDALQHSWYSMAYCILLIFTTTLITHILFPLQGFSQ